MSTSIIRNVVVNNDEDNRSAAFKKFICEVLCFKRFGKD